MINEDCNLALPFCRNSLEHPDAPAVFGDNRRLSYKELAAQAQSIAQWLSAGHSAKEQLRVGILGSRSIEACAGVLGTCWSGGVFVPMNLKWPEERLRHVIEMANLDALIADPRGANLLSDGVLAACPKKILVPDLAHFGKNAATGNNEIRGLNELPPAKPRAPAPMKPDALAYVIFTSGTTGVPKGVMICAGSAYSYVRMMQERFGFNAADRVSENAELSFDVSVSNMFTTWNAGGCLFIVPPTQAMAPAKFIQEHKLTVWSSVPSVISFMQSLRMLEPGAFPTLRYSIFAGEPLSVGSALAWQAAAPGSTVDNLYGPTEATVVTIGYRLTDPPLVTPKRGVVVTGTPLPGSEIAILDQDLNFLPPEKEGELALAGVQLAVGYLNQPELTAKRFPSIGGKRYYLTGDLAYQDKNGIVHHLGRIDNQVKVLGNRVELEEIETHLRAVTRSDMAAAVAWPVEHGAASGIVGFIANTNMSPAQVREALKARVPAYMVPAKIHLIDEIPVTAHGKIDRKTLIQRLDDRRY